MQHGDANATVYTCPMHAEIRQDAPGKCPKCGMTLVPATDAAKDATPVSSPKPSPAPKATPTPGHGAHGKTSEKGHEGMQHGDANPSKGATVYTCPMHPEIRQDAPGKCPKCGMTLVPKKDEPTPKPTAAPKASPTGSDVHQGHGGTP